MSNEKNSILEKEFERWIEDNCDVFEQWSLRKDKHNSYSDEYVRYPKGKDPINQNFASLRLLYKLWKHSTELKLPIALAPKEDGGMLLLGYTERNWVYKIQYLGGRWVNPDTRIPIQHPIVEFSFIPSKF